MIGHTIHAGHLDQDDLEAARPVIQPSSLGGVSQDRCGKEGLYVRWKERPSGGVGGT